MKCILICKYILAIRLIVRGFSKCEWVIGTGNHRKHYVDNENYFQTHFCLINAGIFLNFVNMYII